MIGKRIGAWTGGSLLCVYFSYIMFSALGLPIPSFDQGLSWLHRTPAAIDVREEPIRLSAIPVREIASNDEIAAVLKASRYIQPSRTANGSLPTSVALHAVRLWGRNPKSSKSSKDIKDFPGEELFDFLTDNSKYQRETGVDLLVRSKFGVRVVTVGDGTEESRRGCTHFGKLVQVMGEIGIPSGERVVPAGGEPATFREVIQDLASRVVPEVEQEFAIAGLSRYVNGSQPWLNRFGKPISIDSMARILLTKRPGEGCCCGTHAPHAMAVLLRVNEQTRILETKTAEELRDSLVRLSEILARKQQHDGAWDWNWATGAEGGVVQPRDPLFISELASRMLVTGHHLEWMAIAPAAVRPDDETIRRAARNLINEWPDIEQAVVNEWRLYNPMTHAARALWLLSGQKETPTEVGENDG